MATHFDTQARRKPGAHQLFAIGFQYTHTGGTHFKREQPRWFISAESRRAAIVKVLDLHGVEIATRCMGAVRDGDAFGLPRAYNGECRVLYCAPVDRLEDVFSEPSHRSISQQPHYVTLPATEQRTLLHFFWEYV